MVILLIGAAVTSSTTLDTATLPLPPELRATAAIVSVDKNGKVTKLRDGSGKMVCIADAPGDEVFDARCYHRDFIPVLYRMKQLLAAGVPEGQLNARLEKELKAGKLHMTMKPTAGYRMLGPITALTKDGTSWTAEMSRWQSIHIPRAKAEDLGVITENKVPMPYVMSSGELWAHVMINGPAD